MPAKRRAFTLVELPEVSRGKRAAFTLVELLVAIGVVAVLVGLLLPALNASRAQARSVQCMSNVRQIAGAVLAYADASKTRLPWNYFRGDRSEVTWNGISFLATTKVLAVPVVNDVYTSDLLLCPADDSGVDAGYANVPVVNALFRNNVRLPVLVQYGACPRLLGIPDGANLMTTGTTPVSETLKIRTHYTLSGNHPTWANWPVFPNKTQLPNTVPGDRRPQLRITRCKRPTEAWIVFENSNCDVIPGNMVFRHPKFSANFGYLDGHVENLRTTDIDGGVFVLGTYTVIGHDARTNLTP